MKHSIDVPEEPEEGAVVLDRDGYAWQRTSTTESRWMSHRRPEQPGRLSTEPSSKPWGHLLTDLGPLVELERPPRQMGSDGRWKAQWPEKAAQR